MIASRAVPAAEAAGSHLPPLLVAAERVAASVAQGVHGRRRVGQGDSFWQFRPLLPGESAARIDWRRSARADDGHFVRQTEWEAAQTVALWRGAGPTMRWRSVASLPEKRERAELLLLALAALLLRGGEHVRLFGAGARPVSGRAGLARLAAMLAEAPVAGAPRPIDELPVADGLPRHACVVLIGDWLGDLDATRGAVGGLAALGVTGMMVQVLDPAEVTLPYVGRVRFSAPDPAMPAALIGRAESVRDEYAARLAARQAALADICRVAGLGFLVHRTDHPPPLPLLALHEALSPRRATA